MKRVLITGANGNIGTVLQNSLTDYELTLVDINPEILKKPNSHVLDLARQPKEFTKLLEGHDAVIHLGWDFKEIPNLSSDPLNVGILKNIDVTGGLIVPENKTMAENVYRTASQVRPSPRVIMASSTHAAYADWTKPPYLDIAKRLMRPQSQISVTEINPSSPYGASKVYIEALGKYYSTKGLEVVCIRFGGIRKEDELVDEIGFHANWLSHRDCTNLLRAYLEPERLPSNYIVLYGISGNSFRIYEKANPLGWEPLDNSDRFFSR